MKNQQRLIEELPVAKYRAEFETELKDEERQPCEVWTRVMGYYRPVSYFNIGKQGEYTERVMFTEEKTCRCSELGQRVRETRTDADDNQVECRQAKGG